MTPRTRSSLLLVATTGALISLAAGTSPALADGTNPTPATVVDTATTPAGLAQSLVGAGVSVSGVVFTGDPSARGSFDASDPTVVGFDKGLVLSSGRVTDVVGPNVSDSTSTDFAGAGDQQLTDLAGYPTFDGASLEFDFVPVTNQVVFSYVFASDEYPEWVNTPYNDVFAFFVNGTNCATERQVAGDPSSPFVPVAVNNINASNPVQDPPPPAMRPDLFRPNDVGAAAPLDLELDGITRVLTCRSPVVPGEPNHMKLAIADSSDGIYDSAVFIQAGSLVSNDNPVADLSVYPSAGAAPFTTQAVVEAEDPDGAPLTYTLDFGDGTGPVSGSLPSGTTTVGHTYTYGGHFTMTLEVSNGPRSGTATEDVDVDGSAPPPPPPPPPADVTPPALAPTISDPAPLVGASGVVAVANASDASGIASQACAAVDTATPGLRTLTCTATDTAGNTASATLDYVVGYRATSVKPAAGAKFRRGATVAVSFKMADANGLVSDATAAGLVPGTRVSIGTLAPVTPKYTAKSDTFSASLGTNQLPAGSYLVTISVKVGGVAVTTLNVPVTMG